MHRTKFCKECKILNRGQKGEGRTTRSYIYSRFIVNIVSRFKFFHAHSVGERKTQPFLMHFKNPIMQPINAN